MTVTQRGVLFVAFGAICFSAKAIFIKMAYEKFDVDDITLLTLRFSYALPFFIAIAFNQYRRQSLQKVEKKDWFYIALLSMLGYYWASWFDFKGLQYISAGLERIILFIYPIFVVIFSRIFLKKEISKMAIVALVISYLGIFLIAAEPRIFQSENFIKGGSFILISALTYSLYLVFGGELINKYGSISFNSISMILSSFYVLVHFSVFSETKLFELPVGVHLYGLALATISTVIPTFILMEGIRLIGASRGAIVASIGPVSTILLAYIFLGETLSIQEALGSAMVLIGVLLLGK